MEIVVDYLRVGQPLFTVRLHLWRKSTVEVFVPVVHEVSPEFQKCRYDCTVFGVEDIALVLAEAVVGFDEILVKDSSKNLVYNKRTLKCSGLGSPF